MRWTGQIFWLWLSKKLRVNSQLVFTFLPPSPPKTPGDRPNGSRIQLQQRNCSRFARDFLRRSTLSSSQRTASRNSGLRLALQDLFNQRATNFPVPSTNPPANFVITGGAGFIGSNLTLALQEKFPSCASHGDR